MLMPLQAVPALQVPTLAHGIFNLREDAATHFTMVVFYRGLHCPVCLNYLLELGHLGMDFERRGVKVIAISSDVQSRAQTMADKLNTPTLRIGFELSLKTARDWGLYISTSRGATSNGLEEPALFSEPALFLLRPDGTLYYAAVQTMPFGRPHFDELLTALDFVQAKDYPARGEYLGAV
jgi:peroxiredoxin